MKVDLNAEKPSEFQEKLTRETIKQVTAQNVGFLLGAGSSYLGGKGYPLAAELWSRIRTMIPKDERAKIQMGLDSGLGLEASLDRLDKDGVDFPLRHRVAECISSCFRDIFAPLDVHRTFVRGLSRVRERALNIFNLNYDPLIELSADEEQKHLVDGFLGTCIGYFEPSCFIHVRGIPEKRGGKAVTQPLRGVLNLYKLHGSLGWFVDRRGIVRRQHPYYAIPKRCKSLMIPPQRRKAEDTAFHPYSALWSDFRAVLTNDASRLLNRLVCVGYGLRDNHVNVLIQAALKREHFTLVILTKALSDEDFASWSKYSNTIVATQDRSSLYGEKGAGTDDLWSFEWLSKEIGQNA